MKTRYFLIVLLFIVPFRVYAEVTYHDDFYFSDIQYSYELFLNNENRYDCNGDLSFKINLPQDRLNDIISLFVERTRPHIVEEYRKSFVILSDYTTSLNESPFLNIQYRSDRSYGVRWGMYFRARILFPEGWVYTPTYCVNSFISDGDRQLLGLQSSIEDVRDDNVSFISENGILNITCFTETALSVYDLLGRVLYSGNISEPTKIPLGDISSSIIVIQYSQSNTIKTKKLLVR